MASLRFDFSGETVLVTGASRGIGQAVARGFAAAGAEVYMLATGPGIEAAAATIAAETGATCHPLSCDITDAAAVRSALASIGRLDVLVNNAGLERITPLTDPDPEVEETFRRIIDINVNGTFLVTRHALPKMQPGGRIILTASIWSRTAVAGVLRLRCQQAREPRVHAGGRPRARAEGHHRQRRLPGLGQDGSRHAVAQQHGAAVGPAGAAAARRDRRRAGARRPARAGRHGPALPLPRLETARRTSPGRPTCSTAAR